jgi:hypothetical protein
MLGIEAAIYCEPPGLFRRIDWNRCRPMRRNKPGGSLDDRYGPSIGSPIHIPYFLANSSGVNL